MALLQRQYRFSFEKSSSFNTVKEIGQLLKTIGSFREAEPGMLVPASIFAGIADIAEWVIWAEGPDA